MIQSKNIKKIFEALFEFLIIFVCFFSLYYPLQDFIPYKAMFSKLESDYVYTLNKDYSSLYDDEADIALYHYEYSESGNVLYLNKQGAKMGIHVLAEAPFLAFYKFDIKNYDQLVENVTYDLQHEDIVEHKTFKTNLGSVSLDVDYLIVDDSIENKFDCEYKIYPPNNSPLIFDGILAYEEFFSARGRTMQNTIYDVTNMIGLLLILIAVIPSTVLFIAISLFYSVQIDKKAKQLFINYVFYKKRRILINNVFLEYFIKVIAFAVISVFINYFVFVGNDLMLLVAPLLAFFFVEFLYLYIFVSRKIKSLIKEGVDIKYVN